MINHLDETFPAISDNRFYHGSQTWAQVRQILVDWIGDYMVKRFIDIKVPEQFEVNVYSNRSFNSEHMTIMFPRVYDPIRDEHLELQFNIDNSFPGAVRVGSLVLDNTTSRYQEDGLLPLISLARFKTLKEASSWLLENPKFYSWEVLLSKVP